MQPAMLWWASLIAVAVALYLFRRRPRTVRVTTLPFFQALAREHQEASWLRKLKRLLSLLLSVLVIAALTGALAGLVWAPRADAVRHVVVAIDTSASMAARDGDDRSRLDEAVARVKARLAGVGEGVPVSVLAYDRRPRIVAAATLNRRRVRDALERLRVRPIGGDTARAMWLARRIASMQTPAVVWHYSDAPASRTNQATGDGTGGATASASTRPETPIGGRDAANAGAGERDARDITVRDFTVAMRRAINVGITSFALRRLPLQEARYQAFVQVRAQASEPIDAELEVRLDGQLIALREMTIEPGGRARLLLPIDAGAEQVLTLKAVADDDVLALDDTVHARVPAVRPVRVAWIGEGRDPFTQLALTTLGRNQDVRVYQAAPDQWPIEQAVDVALFDGWLPQRLPNDVAIMALDPPGDVGGIDVRRLSRNGLPVEHLRVTNDKHPVLYGVSNARITVTQTAALSVDRYRGGLTPLWVGPAGPVLAAGHEGGRRMVLMAFDPTRSQRLPLTASYPLLLGNALYWASEPAMRADQPRSLNTGQLVRAPEGSIQWSVPGEEARTMDVSGRWAELDRIGLWHTSERRRGSAALLESKETVLPTITSARDAARNVGAAWWSRLFSGKLATWCLVFALGLLVVESWLFHRHAVY